MNKILATAAVIAIPYSLVVAFLSFLVTSPWVRVYEQESQITFHGFDAVLYLIRSEGLIGYLLGLAPQFIFFFSTIFLALLIQGFVLRPRENA